MRKITKKNLKEVAREVKEMMKDTHKNGVHMEVAIVWNKGDKLSLLDTFSASFLERSDIQAIISYDAPDEVLKLVDIMKLILQQSVGYKLTEHEIVYLRNDVEIMVRALEFL